MDKKKKLTGQQGELMRALDITVDDLLANGEGLITLKQQENTVKKQTYLWQKYDVPAFLLGAVGIVYGVVNWFLSQSFYALIPVLLFLIMATVFYAMGLNIQRKIKADLSKNSVQTLQGTVVVYNQDGKEYLEVSGEKLYTSPDVLQRVQHLQAYIIHYLPASKVILSMEQIDENSNIRESSTRLED